ncbi:hypothetical protein RhoFasB10_04879 [Rhodococcus sp. B10]|uniref:SLC26A/SulP transporter domain-containing protein n=1 Tax=Rhodococcoides kyotonense TaxID=398843 RepID=A0A177YNY3_9NOCA|nr:hypothetical protein [Rhodococcus sp. B10]OAK57302.1 hypothetical protein A3K89_00290 [Rhodococcus kyotonensis]
MSNHYPRHIVFSSLFGYRARFLRPDILAGLTVWAVLVPEALAYATIAGVPPVVGLYAAVPALILYAAAGSSRHLIVGPMSATAALSALRNELERRGLAFRIARDTGQFRDVLVTTGEGDPLPVFVSIADALSAEDPPCTQ